MNAVNGGATASGARARWAVGVDIGGTFTDAIVIDDQRTVMIGKAPSTPPNFEGGFVAAVGAAAERAGLELDELLGDCEIFHGCTIGTNALVEGRTAKVGLLATSGMGDGIFVMQAGRRHWGMPPEAIAHMASHSKPDPPLIPKPLLEEVDERVAFDGAVVVEFNEGQCRSAIQRLIDQGVEAFAVSFMWSVVNPEHERKARALIGEMSPGAFVSISSDVVARAGEYERTVATVINASIGPVMHSYLGDVIGSLSSAGYGGRLHVMSCSGGVMDSEYARALPLLTIGSGPVAGLIGAGTLARTTAPEGGSIESTNVITADMGGTTFDVGVIRRGEALARTTTRHDQYEYFVPTLDVRSIGAGGGSIIRYDSEAGTLRVGPESAGAVPGPAAYPGGGSDPTVSDADLVLGHLNPEFFLGGAIVLDVEAARAALAKVGEPLGFSAEQTAAAAARIVDSQMADAIRLASVQQGYDPRQHVIYAYGGAGPVHASALARELAVTRVVVPLSDLASGWSAFGVVTSEALVVEEQPLVLRYPFDPAELNRVWEELETRVRGVMQKQDIDESSVQFERLADVRYTAQVNDVSIMAPPGAYDAATADVLVETFEADYARLFGEGSGYPDAGYVLTAVRVRARAPRSGQEQFERGYSGAGRAVETGAVDPSEAKKDERPAIFYETGPDPIPVSIYDGDRLRSGMRVQGPAIVEFLDTTIVLRPDDMAAMDPLGSISISISV